MDAAILCLMAFPLKQVFVFSVLYVFCLEKKYSLKIFLFPVYFFSFFQVSFFPSNSPGQDGKTLLKSQKFDKERSGSFLLTQRRGQNSPSVSHDGSCCCSSHTSTGRKNRWGAPLVSCCTPCSSVGPCDLPVAGWLQTGGSWCAVAGACMALRGPVKQFPVPGCGP